MKDECFYLNVFSVNHTLHGVFPRTKKETYNKDKKITKEYHVESSIDNKATNLNLEEFLTQIKALIENSKEETKANTTSGTIFPFTSFTSFIKHASFLTHKNKNH